MTHTLLGPLLMTLEDTNNDSPFVSMGSLGEGWHSWHQAFVWNYAISELKLYQQ